MFGWTLGATSVDMWLFSFETAVEPEMKVTQDQQTKFRKLLAMTRTDCHSCMDSNTRRKTSETFFFFNLNRVFTICLGRL